MKKGRILRLVALSPFVFVFLLIVLICGSSYLDPSEDEIHALVSRHAATQDQAVAWLKSKNRMCTPSPVSDEEKLSLQAFDPYTWKKGMAPVDIRLASSKIFTDFDIKPRSLDTSWARNVLQYYLYFDAQGKLIASRSETICFGF